MNKLKKDKSHLISLSASLKRENDRLDFECHVKYWQVYRSKVEMQIFFLHSDWLETHFEKLLLQN